jgi:prevent-host-death family protein
MERTSCNAEAMMDRIISAAEANRDFSRLLREVREGRSYMVTVDGKPVARIVPCHETDAAREEARSALLRRLAGQPVADISLWTRDKLYLRP